MECEQQSAIWCGSLSRTPNDQQRSNRFGEGGCQEICYRAVAILDGRLSFNPFQGKDECSSVSQETPTWVECDGSFPNSVVHNSAPARYSVHGHTLAHQLEYNPPIHNYISKLVYFFRLLLSIIRNALLINTSTTHATRPTHLIVLDFITLIVTVTTFPWFI